MRSLIFISHANPEENAFTKWLALQLAREGYRVWSDVTRLLGGEDFWSEIEVAIREESAKFLFVASHSSNSKPGVLDELNLARTVERTATIQRFIVPLRVDDISYSAFNIQLLRKNGIDFFPSWAKGLQSLLKLLREDDVPRDNRFSPSEVARWWSRDTKSEEAILETPEIYVSNWFKVEGLPQKIYFHPSADVLDHNSEEYPTRKFGDFYLSLAPRLRHSESRTSIDLAQFLQGVFNPVHISRRDAQNVLSDLIRQAWDSHCVRMGLSTYGLSGDRRAMFIRRGLIDADRVAAFESGRRGRRSVVGARRQLRRDGTVRTWYWHFAVEGLPQIYPELSIAIFPHVLFSDDGQEIWQSKSRLHTARRRQCRSWWNAEWRDRILGTVRWMAGGTTLHLTVGEGQFFSVSITPTAFESPVSYLEPDQGSPVKEISIADEETLEDEEVETS
jgi:hypothetical protein